MKAVEQFLPLHEARLLTYLRLTGCKTGLLINFNCKLLKNGIRRLSL
ncbi:GxxExxY protein [Chitiniphilus eburneus]